MKKIFRWFQKLLRKFKFDNELFEIGVREIGQLVKEELKQVGTKNLKAALIVNLNSKFKRFKKIMNIITPCVENALKTVNLNETNLDKLIERIENEIIAFYNKNF